MTEKEFISDRISGLSSKGVKNFPDDFSDIKDYKEITLPGRTLLLGQEFFGKFEILSVNGSLVYQADNYDEAKYIIYANRLRPKSIIIPVSQTEIRNINSKYEKYIDSVMREIESDFKLRFPASKNLNSAVNEILRVLNLVRY